MNDTASKTLDATTVDDLYAEAEHWQLNLGEETIHAKRQPGTWRRLKWLGSAVWLPFFFGAYLRWDDRQAVLWDIPNRQFHLFGATVLPQDFWMLSLTLLFFAMLLAVVTAIAGRVYCGFFCFQTVWTDVFTWIEDKLEGPPHQRRKLDKAPWDAHKLRVKLIKHVLWLAIAGLTGISFVIWFTDAYEFWGNLVALQLHPTAWIALAVFTSATYVLAGFMREQTCFWLCPYARIQSAMVDKHTVIPSYDFRRGEPRGRVKKKQDAGEQVATGDCVDCKLCLAVCPTGIDIRNGMQEGCVMCALCIDACDGVMDKVKKPRGLVRYASLDEIEEGHVIPLFKRTRVWVYGTVLSLAVVGIAIGLSTLESIELKVLHARQPLYVMQSDGSIQNRYTLKVLNKTTEDIEVRVTATGPSGLELVDAERLLVARNGSVTPATVFVRVPRSNLSAESVPIVFRIEVPDRPELVSERESIFVGPEA